MRIITFFSCVGSILLLCACSGNRSGPPKEPPSTGVVDRAVLDDDPGLLIACPGVNGNGAAVKDYIPTSVSNDDFCRGWLASKESYLCAAYYWFEQASSLGADGLDWSERQTAVRKAIIAIHDVLFDLQDFALEELSQLHYTEDAVQGKCDPFSTSPTAYVLPLQYFRRLKVQATELYRQIAQFYTYALVATADAGRSSVGSVGCRSARP